MKRYIIILMTALAAAFALASCNVAEVPVPKSGILTLTLDSGSMTTKADEVDFETVIDHFDFFFFKDEDGTEPIPGMHGRATGDSKVLNTNTGEEFAALKDITSYVYVVANFPKAIDHSSDLTLAEIRALRFSSSLARTNSSGDVTFSSSLVMDSYNKDTDKYTFELTPKAFEEERTVQVDLRRIAAKFTMEINIPKRVAAKEDGQYWTPVESNLQAYFVNALNSGTTLDAEPVRRSQDYNGGADQLQRTDYFNYPTTYPVTQTSATGDDPFVFETAHAYTYPQVWASGAVGEPYFKIFMPWVHSENGTSNFYYKVVAPKAVEGECTIDRNTWYKLKVDLSVVDTAEEYINLEYSITIVPWANPGFTTVPETSVARFFNVPVKEYSLFSSDRVSVPYSSSSAVSAYFTQITYTYYGASNGIVATYEFNYTKEDNKTNFVLPNEDSSGQTVDTKAKDTNTYSLTAENRSILFQHGLDGVYTERKITFVIENVEGLSETVTVIQHPSIEIKTKETKNGFVNGWFARANADVQDADGNKMGVGPYTATHFGGGSYYHSTDYWTVTNTGGTGSAYPRIDNVADRGRLGIIYGDCETSVHADCLFITEVTVGAFNEDNDTYTITYSGTGAGTYTRRYRIGDPRVPASSRFNTAAAFNIPNYLYSDKTHRTESGSTVVPGGNDLREWEEPLKILIANRDTSANAVIAPRFLVSSNFNNMSSWPQSNETCVRRAATYQEAGYPAGRWRLPTEAEINFMMTLQQKGVIPELYAFGSSYQCANGRAVQITAAGARTSVNPTNCYIRFVYDLWYWGDEPMDPNVYHPNMHEH